MPPMIRKLESLRTSADLFERLHGEQGSMFLDSSLRNDAGRFSIIGIRPYLVIEARGGVTFENGEPVDISFLDCLRHHLRQAGRLLHDLETMMGDRGPAYGDIAHLPLTCGALGFLAYDFGMGFEGIASRHVSRGKLPDACLCFHDILIIEDHRLGYFIVIAAGRLEDAEAEVEMVRSLLEEVGRIDPPLRQTHLADFTSDFTVDGYHSALRRAIGHMVDGDIYVMNMTQRLEMPIPDDPYDMYRYLRTHNPAPFSAYMNGGDWQICCASMERFLRVRDNAVETRPIKGTRPRGDDPETDAANRRELEESAKDHSELLMIVDLERNDLSRVCEPGSVKVVSHFDIEEYATVFHLVSTIEGRLRDDRDALDLVESAFPGGSITGTPKIRAMQIIDELENSRRGLYTGSIGYFSATGDCDLNIVIRTAVCEQGRCTVGVGGGITYESDVGFEYEETLQKAKAIREAIGATADGGAEGR